MFIAAEFIKTKKRKQLKCPSLDKRVNKMWQIHAMESDLAIKKSEF